VPGGLSIGGGTGGNSYSAGNLLKLLDWGGLFVELRIQGWVECWRTRRARG